jgi:hypothetical protein
MPYPSPSSHAIRPPLSSVTRAREESDAARPPQRTKAQRDAAWARRRQTKCSLRSSAVPSSPQLPAAGRADQAKRPTVPRERKRRQPRHAPVVSGRGDDQPARPWLFQGLARALPSGRFADSGAADAGPCSRRGAPPSGSSSTSACRSGAARPPGKAAPRRRAPTRPRPGPGRRWTCATPRGCPRRGWRGAARSRRRRGIPAAERRSRQRNESCAGVSPRRLRRSGSK